MIHTCLDIIEKIANRSGSSKKMSTRLRGKSGAEKLGRVTVTLPSFSVPLLPRLCVDTFLEENEKTTSRFYPKRKDECMRRREHERTHVANKKV